MSEHSHSSNISHDNINKLIAANESSPIHQMLPDLMSQALSEEDYESAWVSYSDARKKTVAYVIARMLGIVRQNNPEAAYVLLYEDHSHDAPHGHVEAFLDKNHHVIELDTDWHDVEWSNEVDEYVWDIYNLGKETFSLIEGKRRLLIKA